MAVAFRSLSTGTQAFGAGNWTTSLPVGTADGDLLLLRVTLQPTSVTFTTPSGWTLVHGPDNGTNGVTRAYLFRKVAVSEVAPTLTPSGSCEGRWEIASYTGADQAAPINASAVGTAGGTSVIAAPQITPTVDNCMIVGLFGTRDSANLNGSGTVGSGFTEDNDVFDFGTNTYEYHEHKLQAAAAAITPDFTQATAACTGYVCHSVAIKPAGGAGGGRASRLALLGVR